MGWVTPKWIDDDRPYGGSYGFQPMIFRHYDHQFFSRQLHPFTAWLMSMATRKQSHLACGKIGWFPRSGWDHLATNNHKTGMDRGDALNNVDAWPWLEIALCMLYSSLNGGGHQCHFIVMAKRGDEPWNSNSRLGPKQPD